MKSRADYTPPTRKEIIAQMEKLQPHESLKFQLSPTFGGSLAILERNPAYPEKHQKKFLLWIGDDEADARKSEPYDSADKAKRLAAWVADRWPLQLVSETV